MSRDDMSVKIKGLEQTDILQKEQIALLKHENAQLKRLLFSARSERHIPKTENPEQLSLDFGELAPTDMEAGAELKDEKIKVEYERRKKKHVGRHPLPEHFSALAKSKLSIPSNGSSMSSIISPSILSIKFRICSQTKMGFSNMQYRLARTLTQY